MKGGGGSYGYSRQVPGNIPNISNECESLLLSVQLYNLTEEINNRTVGDILDISLTSNNLIEATYEQRLCGSITDIKAAKLITCIKKGYKYKATIKILDEQSCIVVIKNYQRV